MGEEISKRRVSISETLDLLEERKKVGALSYEQQMSYEYCKKFLKLPYAKAKEVIDKIVEVGIPEEMAINIVEIFPDHKSTLEAIMIRHEKDVDKVMSILEDYRKETEAEHAEDVEQKSKPEEMNEQTGQTDKGKESEQKTKSGETKTTKTKVKAKKSKQTKEKKK